MGLWKKLCSQQSSCPQKVKLFLPTGIAYTLKKNYHLRKFGNKLGLANYGPQTKSAMGPVFVMAPEHFKMIVKKEEDHATEIVCGLWSFTEKRGRKDDP